jgi:uncharacterized hydrophobic protein (TIGR00271 family)
MSNFFDFLNLHNGEDERTKVLESVKSNISFRGSNLWILACAIVIASVGLNVNSTAVVIGAMLISPLMGPIVGAGFALAIYDFELLKKSGRNLLNATIVGLVVATLYFWISPFKETQSEILSRTSPNIYDVLIAFFGGLVGVIAITRVEKGNPIPGVAIATALMPPLCTAGYGLALGNYQYFFGAFYLYCINCFFICIATFIIIKYLKYHPVKSINIKFEKQIKYGIAAIVFLMIVPSFYLAYNLLNQKKYSQNVDQFINNELSNKGHVVIYKKTNFQSNPKQIELAFLSKRFSSNEIDSLKNKLLDYNLKNTTLIIKQDGADLKNEILNEISNQSKNISEKDLLINNLRNELSEYKFDNTEIENEISIIFPELINVSIGKHIVYQNTGTAKTLVVVLFELKDKDKIVNKEMLHKWLVQKLKTLDIKLIEQE